MSVPLASLDANTQFFIQVDATTEQGHTSAPASIDVATLIGSPPSPPHSVTQTGATGGAIEITWRAPFDSGGVPMLHYVVSVSGGDMASGLSQVVATTSTAPTASTTVYGLSNNHQYVVAIRGVNTVNLIGEPVMAPVATNVVATTPGVVSAMAVTERLGGSLRLAWKPPLDSGGYNVSFYTVECGVVGGSSSVLSQSPTTPDIMISGLQPRTQYAVRVAAITAWRIGQFSPPFKATTGPISPPLAPVVLSFKLTTPSSGQLRVALGDTGGVALSSLSFRATVYDTTADSSVVVASATPTLSIAGLVNGHQYTFTVVAVNPVGASPVSAPHLHMHALSDRSAELRVVLVRSTQILIAWDEPKPSDTLSLSGYKVRALGGRACIRAATYCDEYTHIRCSLTTGAGQSCIER